MKGASVVRERNVKATTEVMAELQESRSNLRQLIYAMEHDRSLDAQMTRLGILKNLLNGIERQIGSAGIPSLHTLE